LISHIQGNLYGFLSFVSVLVLLLTSFGTIRRKLFELFIYPHTIVALLSFALGMLHSKDFRYYAIVPLSLYGLDRLVRFYIIARSGTVSGRSHWI